MEKLCHSYGQRLEELLTTYGEKVKSYGQHMEELSRRYGDTFESYGEIQKPYGEALEKVLQIVKNSGEMSNGYGETAPALRSLSLRGCKLNCVKDGKTPTLTLKLARICSISLQFMATLGTLIGICNPDPTKDRSSNEERFVIHPFFQIKKRFAK
ncbi:hypothetical protein BH09BAC3_BH09BAC3_07000 [soil metagenome]